MCTDIADAKPGTFDSIKMIRNVLSLSVRHLVVPVVPEIAPPSAARCAAEIRRTVSHLHRKLRPRLLRDGISMAKLNVIGQINRVGRITPTELAAREGVKVQTLTRLLAELEADGWLSRLPHESDGRQTVLSVTRQGTKRLTEAARASDLALAEIIETTLTAGDRVLLLRACVLLDGLDAALGGKPNGPADAGEARP
jgi:DNA-binding MarR family transcriptional regulator